MLQPPILTYEHLVGWKPLIDRLLADIEAATGPHAFRMTELKERYGALRLRIERVDEAPFEVIAAAETVIAAAEAKSQYICIDCGAPAMLHEWNTDWILPCCPTHARERAKAVTSFYTGPGWRLTPAFQIVDETGTALTEAQTRALDLAATRQERRTGQVVVADSQAADWRAARWMAGPTVHELDGRGGT